jgi:uncharacterized protein (UPF0179 family)
LANVTLIGEKQAKKDNMFIYIGPLSECRDCKVKTVCFNLEEGRMYKIKDVRAMHHNCKVHEGGVRAVEYELMPIECAISSDAAMEKARITMKEQEDCINRGCENYSKCFPIGLKTGSQYEITTVKGKLTCSEGKELKEVVLIDVY